MEDYEKVVPPVDHLLDFPPGGLTYNDPVRSTKDNRESGVYA